MFESKNCITNDADCPGKYPVKITGHYINLIDWDNPNDPIRRMVDISSEEECTTGMTDPSDEASNVKIKGLQHKYPQTVLLLISNVCACNCRFCFRRRFVGTSKAEIVQDWDKVIKYIDEHKEINNVLLSGGDPLMLDTNALAQILKMLAPIPHLDFIRIGTRMLAYAPERFDEELISLLFEYSNTLMLITHFNHPIEVREARWAIMCLKDYNISMSNQTTLLKGVNDDGKVLAALNNSLVEGRIMPYYIFQVRPVKGASHFAVPLKDGVKVINECRRLSNGIAKRFRYIMSHTRGKIEILDYVRANKSVALRFHQSKAIEKSRVFLKHVEDDATWIETI